MSSASNWSLSKYDSSSDDDSRIRIENWESDEDERQLIRIYQPPLLIESISSDDSDSAISNRTNSVVPQKKSWQNTKQNTIESAQKKFLPWSRNAVSPIKPSKCLFHKAMGEVSKENSNYKVFETQIEWDTLESPQNSQNIASRTSTLPAVIDFQKSRTFGTAMTQPKSYTKKCCRDGGFVQQLQRALATAKTDRKYFEHDKKFGLQVGTLMRVLYLEASFGVDVATVQIQWVFKDCSEDATIRVIIDADMVSNVKIGSTLEAFITNDREPYVNGAGTKHETLTFVRPFKLMVL